VDEAVDHLYAVPLEEFVKERTRLSRELRKQDRDAAAELAKLPKPTAPAWALNHIAREDPDAMGEWLGTADALREASNRAAELGGDTVRGAMAAHRESTRQLTEVVREQARPGGRELSEAMLRRVGTLLQSATADEELAERLRAGRITEDAPEDSTEDSDEIVWTAAPAPKKPKRRKPEPEPEPEPEEDPRAARLAELERLEAETEEEATRLRAAAEESEARAEEADKALKRARSEAEAAHAAADDADEAAAAAERELRQIRQRLRRAKG
jgi:hypothetical protein